MNSGTKGLAITYVCNVFGHGIDVELVNIVPLPQHGPLLTWTLTPRALLSLIFPVVVPELQDHINPAGYSKVLLNI